MFCFFPCQIGDFGMARDLANDSVYHSQGGKIPVKWTAPEVKTYAIFRQKSTCIRYFITIQFSSHSMQKILPRHSHLWLASHVDRLYHPTIVTRPQGTKNITCTKNLASYAKESQFYITSIIKLDSKDSSSECCLLKCVMIYVHVYTGSELPQVQQCQ